MSTNINFVEKLDAGCDTQVSFNLPKTLSLGTVKKSFDNNGLSEAEGCSYLALNTLNQAGLLGKASLIVNPSSFSENTIYADLPANSTLGDLTFTRATDAWRTNSQGLIQRTPWNLLQYSEQFDNAYWIKDAGVSVNANYTTAPDGTMTADRLNLSIGGAIYRSSLALGTGSFTLSVWLKGEGANIGKQILLELTNGNATVTLTGDWQRFTTVGTNVVNVAIKRNTINQADSVYAWGAQLVEGSSALEYFPTTDRLDVPRIDYSLGGCPNILLEPQRTNLALRSQEFDNASWGKFYSSVTANSTTSPSGVVDADTFTADGAFGLHALTQIGNSINGTTYTHSIYAKKNTNDFIQLIGTGSIYTNATTFANFDLNLGVVGLVGAGTTASIQDIGNGWYRCTMTATATATTSGSFIYPCLVTSATSPRAENNSLSTSVFLWGAQLEAGAYATSYIPTTTASVTRNADSITRNNIFTNGLITAAGGTWFVELSNNRALLRDIFAQSIGVGNSGTPGSVTNGFYLANAGGTQTSTFRKITGPGAEASLFSLALGTSKIAVKWNGSTMDVFQNGVKVVTATAFPFTNLEFLFGYGTDVPKYINEMALFPTPLTDVECIALTT